MSGSMDNSSGSGVDVFYNHVTQGEGALVMTCDAHGYRFNEFDTHVRVSCTCFVFGLLLCNFHYYFFSKIK